MESGRSTRLHGLMVRKFACTNTSLPVGRRLTIRERSTAWTTGARIFVDLEEPTEMITQTNQALLPSCRLHDQNHGNCAYDALNAAAQAWRASAELGC